MVSGTMLPPEAAAAASAAAAAAAPAELETHSKLLLAEISAGKEVFSIARGLFWLANRRGWSFKD